MLFEDDHPLVLADFKRRVARGRVGEIHEMNPPGGPPSKPKWIRKTIKMMKTLKARVANKFMFCVQVC